MKSIPSNSFISPTTTLCSAAATETQRNNALQSVKNLFKRASLVRKDRKTNLKLCAKTIVQERIIKYTQESQASRSRCMLELQPPGYVSQAFGPPVKLLGSGTDGYVNLHVDPAGVKFAIKSFFCPKKRFTSLNECYEALDSEIRMSVMFNHPNIVRVYRMIYEANGYIYIVMEYCDQDLFSLISNLDSSPAERIELANYMFYQLVQAVSYLHNNAFVVHRDIKLDNICVTKDHTLKLVDFGCSVSYDPLRPFGRYGLTGSDPYIAPEIFLLANSIYDPRCTDVWAIGIVYLAMLSSRFPWEIAKVSDKNFNLFLSQKHKLLQYWVQHDPVARSLISDILSVDPSKRPNISAIKSHPFFINLHSRYSNTNDP
ncbi:hypothetical protein BB560_005249 [Smittium megazygosporum]|uniref:Protein kinase domain-containing protein n=1 Tax=Smittium megazygosporum TaxID=133381 RepID=A0A2T9Z755_9FUNG|nr:hypothetical protein BB560_005249 [Smittium megazygosporum]